MAYTVYIEKIPRELVISMDETFVWYIPMGNAYTFHSKGAKQACCWLLGGCIH